MAQGGRQGRGGVRLYPFLVLSFGGVWCWGRQNPSSASTRFNRVLADSVNGHQVMLRVFFFFATFGEALSQTAQAFIPGQLAKERSLEEAKAAAKAAAVQAGAAPSEKEVRVDPRLSPARTMMR